MEAAICRCRFTRDRTTDASAPLAAYLRFRPMEKIAWVKQEAGDSARAVKP